MIFITDHSVILEIFKERGVASNHSCVRTRVSLVTQTIQSLYSIVISITEKFKYLLFAGNLKKIKKRSQKIRRWYLIIN